MTPDDAGHHADPVEETRRLLVAADAAGIAVRAVGGVAIAIRAPTVAQLEPRREYHDIDLAARSRSGPELSKLMVSLGYVGAEPFNKLNGSERLLYHDPQGRRVDVFLDRLRMCHMLEFAHRLTVDRLTLSLADLALSKLQIVEQTARDTLDLIALFADHELTDDDAGLNQARIAEVCASDWGWWRTVTGNLASFMERCADKQSPAAVGAAQRARVLVEVIDAAQKTAGWRIRAIIGERKAWYELPEEVR